MNFGIFTHSICLRAFSPGQLAGECSSRGWADQRRSRETECPGLAEGWMQAETEKIDLNRKFKVLFSVVTSEIPNKQLIVDCV